MEERDAVAEFEYRLSVAQEEDVRYNVDNGKATIKVWVMPPTPTTRA